MVTTIQQTFVILSVLMGSIHCGTISSYPTVDPNGCAISVKNFTEKNSLGGIQHKNVTDAEQCLTYCVDLVKPPCLAVDFDTQTNETFGCWVHTNVADLKERYDTLPGVVQYEVFRDCNATGTNGTGTNTPVMGHSSMGGYTVATGTMANGTMAAANGTVTTAMMHGNMSGMSNHSTAAGGITSSKMGGSMTTEKMASAMMNTDTTGMETIIAENSESSKEAVIMTMMTSAPMATESNESGGSQGTLGTDGTMAATVETTTKASTTPTKAPTTTTPASTTHKSGSGASSLALSGRWSFMAAVVTSLLLPVIGMEMLH